MMFNSIRTKILASNGILLVVLLLVLLFALTQLHYNQQLLNEEDKAVVALTEMAELEEAFAEFRLASVEFMVLLQNKNKAQRDNQYQALKYQFNQSTYPAIKTLETELDRYYEQIQKATTAFIDNDKIQGGLLLSQAEHRASVMLETLKTKYFENKKIVSNIIEAIHQSNSRVSFSLYSLLGAMLVIGMGMSVFLANLISRALANLQHTVEAIEHSGDLTKQAEVKSDDEIGRLAGAFNGLVNNLAKIVREVIGQSAQLATAAEQLSTVSEQTSQGVQQQSGEIIQVAAAMNEMSATVREVASSTEQALTSVEAGNNEANHGSRVVDQTITAISELASDVQGASGVIEKLKDDSENINTVLDVIKTIAEQTNLLALNAAIEAARAGEQGRGFAVVADEVRTLAQRTQQSTTEIEALIDALQNGATESVKVMEQSLEKAEATVTQASQAGQSLAAINQSVANILMMNTQIASAAEEQSATTEEINRNINNIKLIADQTASGAEKTAASSNELSHLSEQLRGLVGQFKV